MTDPAIDRLMRHMAWANQQLIARLAEQPDRVLGQPGQLTRALRPLGQEGHPRDELLRHPLGEAWRVSLHEDLLQSLEAHFGPEHVKVIY